MPEQEGFHSFMQQEKAKKAICWALVAACMMLIFYFSSRNADESAKQSRMLLAFIEKIFGSNSVTDFIVRKSAHCLEFTGLALLFNIALFVQKNNKIQPLSATAFSSLYAVTDEIHQIFVDGRSCQISDWAIDTAGAILGTIAFLIIYFSIIKYKKSKTS